MSVILCTLLRMFSNQLHLYIYYIIYITIYIYLLYDHVSIMVLPLYVKKILSSAKGGTVHTHTAALSFALTPCAHTGWRRLDVRQPRCSPASIGNPCLTQELANYDFSTSDVMTAY